MKTEFCSVQIILDASGALYYPAERLLVVADLHIEKGRSIGLRFRRPIPPYDTHETLRRLNEVVMRYDPKIIICLGDSFHDSAAMLRFEPAERNTIAVVAAGRRWIWIIGNHDPIISTNLGGEVAEQITIGPLLFRHSGIDGNGVVIGHFHPVAKACINGQILRRRCFVFTEQLIIMPAFGSYTGGLNVLHPVLDKGLGVTHIFMLGSRGVYLVNRSQLLKDTGRK